MELRKSPSPSAVLREFVDDTSVHGVRYIARPHACLLDRLVWLVAVAACMACCVLMVLDVWQSYKNSPTVTSVENTHHPLDSFPFPAVTICTSVRVQSARGLELLHRFLREEVSEAVLAEATAALEGSLDDALRTVMAVLSFYQHPFYYRMEDLLKSIVPLLPLLEGLNISRYMLESMIPCEELFLSCYWHGISINCCEEFHVQPTEQGYCYSFNSLTSVFPVPCPGDAAHRLANGPFDVRDCELRRTGASGGLSALEVFTRLAPFDELPPGMQRDLDAFRVTVHHPGDVPSGLDYYAKARLNASADQVVNAFRISPQATVSTDALRSLPPHQRRCLFPEDITLDIFRTYTLQNCMVECRQDYIAERCGCRTYFFGKLNPDMRDCNITDLQCVSLLSLYLRFSEPPPDYTRDWREDQQPMDCTHCLPPCHSMKYNVDMDASRDTEPQSANASLYLDIFYNDMGAVKYRRDIPFTSTHLLVYFGGMLSFFLGLSILSAVEIAYYLWRLAASVLRLAMSSRRLKRAEKRKDERQAAPSWEKHLPEPRSHYRRRLFASDDQEDFRRRQLETMVYPYETAKGWLA